METPPVREVQNILQYHAIPVPQFLEPRSPYLHLLYGARLTVGLEEPTLADVHDGVSNLGLGNIVELTVAVRVDGLARGTARVRSVVVRGTARHRGAWNRKVAPGYGKGKI